MAEVIRYVDPDATGAGDGTSWTDAYTSLSAWNTGEATDLVSAGDWHHVYCRSSSGTADSTVISVGGWTTDSTHYILIEAADGDQAVKSGLDTSRYRHSSVITIAVSNVYISGIQGTKYYTVYAVGNLQIDACRFTNASGYPVEVRNMTGDLTITNSIIEILGAYRLYMRGCTGTNLIYNCTIYGGGSALSGPYARDSNLTITNSAVFSTADDFSAVGTGVITASYCASDDGDGTNAVSPSGSDWDNEFADPANGDFTLLNTGNLYDAGIGPSSDANVPTTDIDGDTRSGTTCDIGADEYSAGGGGDTSIPVIMHHYAMMRK